MSNYLYFTKVSSKMSGIIRPAGASQYDVEAAAKGRWSAALYAYRWFLGLVILPTALVAAYYYLVASDQYESRADFVVRRAGANATGGAGVGQILGFSIGASESHSEARIVEDYLLSQDAVSQLRKEDSLVERFQRDSIDLLSRLRHKEPTPEDLLRYYNKHVTVEFDADKGISSLSVRAFRPDDAYALAKKLLSMGEAQVNRINERTSSDAVSAASRELAAAEQDMSKIQTQMTAFRRIHDDIDPAGTGKAQIGLVTELTANLAMAKANLAAMEGFVSHASPQYRALAAQVHSLEMQVASQSSKLASTGGGNTIATKLGSYEELGIRQEFAGKRYIAAAAAYQEALAEARKQQLYLISVVQPNVPVKSLFPERGRIVMTVFFSLAIAYAIGWLMVAGVREHSVSS
ncbi:lipopolysaccharide biosynthesis protein [Novosphingobium album (ex Hu et al. 2023)]|uniref:Lipopolysaccharide biosynthesis protein n=1 Tax=Novosphingobium album (ex Hu et al. 2023) TaxID=2930093 RepID=A0ABT0B6B0_9SPHN|nr:lipopolysaccharide biosynthesis protein [Novosphingobium album (ex Hu et al. 2023)]MCJ2180612.1 lipopolysaccharide biosynthesis protein [Novosphingobium album (ex Hu et al. 2023)]